MFPDTRGSFDMKGYYFLSRPDTGFMSSGDTTMTFNGSMFNQFSPAL